MRKKDRKEEEKRVRERKRWGSEGEGRRERWRKRGREKLEINKDDIEDLTVLRMFLFLKYL